MLGFKKKFFRLLNRGCSKSSEASKSLFDEAGFLRTTRSSSKERILVAPFLQTSAPRPLGAQDVRVSAPEKWGFSP
jgi:hypothetical protein